MITERRQVIFSNEAVKEAVRLFASLHPDKMPHGQIRRVCTDDFQLAYGRTLHSDRLVVVDRHGKVQGAYRATEDAQMVLLKRKLAELVSGQSSVVSSDANATDNH